MAKNFDVLRVKMSPASRAKSEAHRARLARQVTLRTLRTQRGVTQQAVAEGMENSQGEVSKLEQRGDWLVSTLRSYVESLGGELNLVVRFEDGTEAHIAPVADVETKPARELVTK